MSLAHAYAADGGRSRATRPGGGVRSGRKRGWRAIGVTVRARCGNVVPHRAQWSMVDQHAAV
jgi:hypothetical protein